MEQYRQSLLSNPLLKAGLTNQVGDKKIFTLTDDAIRCSKMLGRRKKLRV